MPTARTDALRSIQQLLATSQLAISRNSRQMLSEVYSADAVLESNEERFEGRAEIVDAIFRSVDEVRAGAAAPDYTLTRHTLLTSKIIVENDSMATGRTFFKVVTDTGADHPGVYVDRYEKRSGKWEIAFREVRLDTDLPADLIEPTAD